MSSKNSEAQQRVNTNWASIENNRLGNIDMAIVAKSKNDFTTFEFDKCDVRVVTKNGEPWFLASDLCDVLGLDATAIRKLDDDEKGLHLTQTHGGVQNVAVVSESGMWTLVLRCRDAVKPGTVPYRVRKWVTSEVLPSIRKNGEFKAKSPSRRQIKTRDDLSFTKRDEMGRLLNWFVPDRKDSFHEHVRIGQEFFAEIVELAKSNPKEAYQALRFSGEEMMRFGSCGHSVGFADMWAKFAMMAIINKIGINEPMFGSDSLAMEPKEGIEHYFNRVH